LDSEAESRWSKYLARETEYYRERFARANTDVAWVFISLAVLIWAGLEILRNYAITEYEYKDAFFLFGLLGYTSFLFLNVALLPKFRTLVRNEFAARKKAVSELIETTLPIPAICLIFALAIQYSGKLDGYSIWILVSVIGFIVLTSVLLVALIVYGRHNYSRTLPFAELVGSGRTKKSSIFFFAHFLVVLLLAVASISYRFHRLVTVDTAELFLVMLGIASLSTGAYMSLETVFELKTKLSNLRWLSFLLFVNPGIQEQRMRQLLGKITNENLDEIALTLGDLGPPSTSKPS